MDRCLVIIPARMASSRFPGKPLIDLCGKPMVQWVYESCHRANVGEVLVATPDPEIEAAVALFGGLTILTRADHPSGTDRLAEVAQAHSADVYLNVQGDEPLISVQNIKACAALIMDRPEVKMASLYADCRDADDELNPAVVKVVTDLAGDALYFSRFAIPYPRSPRSEVLKHHLGIYAYRKEVLLQFSQWPVSQLESAEGLEQLRFLDHGVRIRMGKGESAGPAIDTPAQAEEVRKLLMETQAQ